MIQEALLAIAKTIIKGKIIEGLTSGEALGAVSDIVNMNFPNMSKQSKNTATKTILALVKNGGTAGSEKERKSVDPDQLYKQAKKEGKRRSMGYVPRIIKQVGNTLGDVVDLASDVAGMGASSPYTLTAAMADAVPRTKFDEEIGLPNVGAVMRAVGGTYGAIPRTAISGAGRVAGDALRGVGDMVYDRNAEKMYHQNTYHTQNEVLNADITPSQANLGGRIMSGQNWAYKRAAGSGGN